MFKQLKEKINSYDLTGYSACSIIKNVWEDIKLSLNKHKTDEIPVTPDNYDDITEDTFTNLSEQEQENIKKHMTYSSARFNVVEYMRYEQFKKDHYDNCKFYRNGKYQTEKCPIPPTILIQNTGIGTGFSVRCENCHKIVDITDYDCW